MTWSFVFVNAEAKAELDALPADFRASFERIVGLVRALGLEQVHEPHIKHINGRPGKCGCVGGTGSRAFFTSRRLVSEW